MLYRDLVNFDSLETVIQLEWADDRQEAYRLVKTYVISDRMARLLLDLVIPQLQIDTPRDNRGVLIVGNYGTGKSHLMSVLSALAEYPDLTEAVTHDAVREKARRIAGIFKVKRVEIGSTTRSLRDNLLQELEDALHEWGIDYTFPSADSITNNKDSLVAALALFQQAYPEQGLLLVVDELLDYLKSRKERELILDLGFLRELGEVTAATPFRFIGGVQESLFDNPSFSFVGEQLRRVRDRFEQVRIAREDIAYVVSHRLLRKNDAQLAQITTHLQRFAPLYNQMAERMTEFAQLFPIHPAYIDTFEKVYVAEKREVLKTFSRAIEAILDQEVPANAPGLISYDHYWQVVRDNASLRSLEGIAEVVDRSAVLEGRVAHAFPAQRQRLLPVARRLIHALSVHRLTTDGIRVPIGATPEELRDDLCLHMPMPEADPEFLLAQINVTLGEIIRVVSGQFLSHNQENGQYYIDVDKVIDFDAKVKDRGEALGNDAYNRYFFDALRQSLGLGESTYVTNFRIWEYGISWPAKNVERPGYFFMGLPSERSTAQPPQDGYVYFLPPFGRDTWEDEQRPDEVIFSLAQVDDAFSQIVRLYAGASVLARESVEYRQIYGDKAREQIVHLRGWLTDNLVSQLQVRYQGVQQSVGAALPALSTTAAADLKELIDRLAAHYLGPHFAEKYPRYPHFKRLSQPVTEANRAANALEAVRFLAGRAGTNLALAVLDGLQLLDEQNRIQPARSPYAQAFLQKLQQKEDANQVVNRGELIAELHGYALKPIEKDLLFGLEPEWVVVVLLALVYNGDIALNLDGRETLDAGSIDRAALRSMSDLTDFRFYRRPRTLPVPLWVEIFQALDLPPGLIRDENSRDEAVRQLASTVRQELEQLVRLQHDLQQGGQLWNRRLFTDAMTLQMEHGQVVAAHTPQVSLRQDDFTPHLRRYKKFLEALTPFDRAGKLQNLRLGMVEIEEAHEDRGVMARALALLQVVGELQSMTSYLAEARGNLPDDHDWSVQADALQDDLIMAVRRYGKGEADFSLPAWQQELAQLKQAYIQLYAALHRQMVLGHEGETQRERLRHDPRLRALQALAEVELLQAQGGAELSWWQAELKKLPASRTFHEGVLAHEPTHEQFRPRQYPPDFQAQARLDFLAAKLDDFLTNWQQALQNSLQSETARRNWGKLSPAEREPIETFLQMTPGTTQGLPPQLPQMANRALHGIELALLSLPDLVQALQAGGLPCTRQEMEARFQTYLGQVMQGKDAGNTRLTFDDAAR